MLRSNPLHGTFPILCRSNLPNFNDAFDRKTKYTLTFKAPIYEKFQTNENFTLQIFGMPALKLIRTMCIEGEGPLCADLFCFPHGKRASKMPYRQRELIQMLDHYVLQSARQTPGLKEAAERQIHEARNRGQQKTEEIKGSKSGGKKPAPVSEPGKPETGNDAVTKKEPILETIVISKSFSR